MPEKFAIVALSGGVDSAVSAFLLKKQGYVLHAVFMKNWDPEVNGEDFESAGDGCASREDLIQAQKIADQLEIPLTIYNFVPEYWEEVFMPFLNMIKERLISNPDILCNSKIKFGALLNKLKEDFSPNIKIATGHYAKVIEKNNKFFLGIPECDKKDQTYFLSRLTSKQLSSIIFPLGEVKDKEEVRKIAKENNLENWDRKDSTGICFIGKRNFPSFLNNYLEFEKGNIVDIEDNVVLGTHNGLNLYALHQNYGLNLSGWEEKYYVCKKDHIKNILYVCKKTKIPQYLYSTTSIVKDLFWINEAPDFKKEIWIKFRNLGKYILVKVIDFDGNQLKLSHPSMFITTPGQYIVFYDLAEKICLGSGIYLMEQ